MLDLSKNKARDQQRETVSPGQAAASGSGLETKSQLRQRLINNPPNATNSVNMSSAGNIQPTQMYNLDEFLVKNYSQKFINSNYEQLVEEIGARDFVKFGKNPVSLPPVKERADEGTPDSQNLRQNSQLAASLQQMLSPSASLNLNMLSYQQEGLQQSTSQPSGSSQAQFWLENGLFSGEAKPMLLRESISATMIRGLQAHFEEDYYLRCLMPTMSHPVGYLTEQDFQSYTESDQFRLDYVDKDVDPLESNADFEVFLQQKAHELKSIDMKQNWSNSQNKPLNSFDYQMRQAYDILVETGSSLFEDDSNIQELQKHQIQVKKEKDGFHISTNITEFNEKPIEFYLPKNQIRAHLCTSLELVCKSSGEKRGRKILHDTSSLYAFHDLFMLNLPDNKQEHLEQIKRNRRGLFAKGAQIDAKNLVNLFPQVVKFENNSKDFEIMRGFRMDDPYVSNLIFILCENPYASAKFFNSLVQKQELEGDSPEIRSLLFSMSQNLYRNLQDVRVCQNKDSVNKKFLQSFKIFIQNCDKYANNSALESLKEEKKVSDQTDNLNSTNQNFKTLKSSLIKIIKPLFEGQTRNEKCNILLEEIFRPTFKDLNIFRIQQKLADLKQNINFEKKRDEKQIFAEIFTEQTDPGDVIDQCLYQILTDQQHSHEKKETKNENQKDIMSQLIADHTSTNFPTVSSQQESQKNEQFGGSLHKSFFEPISRKLPEPQTNFDKHFAPLTSIFRATQLEFGLDFTLPDSREINYDFMNTGLLLRDCYIPNDIVGNNLETNSKNQKQSDESAQYLTCQIIEIVDLILKSVQKSIQKIPYEIKFMLKLILEDSNLSQDDKLYIMADLLSGTWLSCGFRWPELFGLIPVFKEESRLMANIMQASRLLFESCLSCKTLPQFDEDTQLSFDVQMLNSFISDKTELVSCIYSAIMSEIDLDSIQVPNLKQAKKDQKPDNHINLHEITQIRLQDLATLLKNIYGQMINDFDEKVRLENAILDFTYTSLQMIKDERTLKRLLSAQKVKLDQDEKDRLENIWRGLKSDNFSLEMSWICVDDRIEQKVLDQFQTVQKVIQKIYKQPFTRFQRKGRNRWDLTFNDAIFRDQILLFPKSIDNAIRAFKNYYGDIDAKQEKESIRKFVDDNYQASSSVHRQADLIGGKASTAVAAQSYQLPTFGGKSLSKQRSNLSMITEDLINESNQSILNDTNFMLDESMDSIQQHSQTTTAKASGSSMEQTQTTNHNINVSSVDGSERNTTQVKHLVTKNHLQHNSVFQSPQGERMAKEDQIAIVERLYYHFVRALNLPNFLHERINDYILTKEGLVGVQETLQRTKGTLDLEELFKRVEEDEKKQPDMSMSLLLDSQLIRRFYAKLKPKIKAKLMDFFKRRLLMQLKNVEKNFEELNVRQMLSMDRALKFCQCIQKSRSSLLKFQNESFIGLFNRAVYKLKDQKIYSKSQMVNLIDQILTSYAQNSSKFESKPRSTTNSNLKKVVVKLKDELNITDKYSETFQNTSILDQNSEGYFFDEKRASQQIQYSSPFKNDQSVQKSSSGQFEKHFENLYYNNEICLNPQSLIQNIIAVNHNIIQTLYLTKIKNVRLTDFVDVDKMKDGINRKPEKENHKKVFYIGNYISSLYALSFMNSPKIQCQIGNSIFVDQIMLGRLWQIMKKDLDLIQIDQQISKFFTQSSGIISLSSIKESSRRSEIILNFTSDFSIENEQDLFDDVLQEIEAMNLNKQDELFDIVSLNPFKKASEILVKIDDFNFPSKKLNILEKTQKEVFKIIKEKGITIKTDQIYIIFLRVLKEAYNMKPDLALHLNLVFLATTDPSNELFYEKTRIFSCMAHFLADELMQQKIDPNLSIDKKESLL